VYVCICHAVTDAQIREFAAKNGCNWRKMTDELGTGTSCGSCAIKAKKILTETCAQHKTHERRSKKNRTAAK